MKTRKNMKSHATILILALVSAGSVSAAVGAQPVVSLSQKGLLVCTNLQPGSVDTVEMSTSFKGLWGGLSQLTATSKGMIQATVPLTNTPLALFRVVELPPPTFTGDGMALVPAGSFIMGDSVGDGIPDATSINVYVSAFDMDTNLVSYAQWQATFSYATNIGYSFDNVGSARNNVTNQPVQTINWYDAVKWCNARSQKAGLTPVYYTDAGLTKIYTNGDTDAVFPNWS